jgi:hypothetical protein
MYTQYLPLYQLSHTSLYSPISHWHPGNYSNSIKHSSCGNVGTCPFRNNKFSVYRIIHCLKKNERKKQALDATLRQHSSSQHPHTTYLHNIHKLISLLAYTPLHYMWYYRIRSLDKSVYSLFLSFMLHAYPITFHFLW